MAGRDLRSRLAALSLEDKVRLLTGATTWRLQSSTEVGLRSIVVSDGPAGVRGTGELAGETSASFPAPSALSATWDVELAARVGLLFAAEARRHGVDVVLSPVVNLQRTPVGGRHFECYSEDPLLTARIAGELIGAMQGAGVAACVKHFVANDSETGRTEYVARVSERALREVYLAPFEHAVRVSRVWTLMAAYNGLDAGGEVATMTEHHHLLRDVLKDEWGFDGVVMSDWLATRSAVASANAGLDLVMPGPHGPWGDDLLDAVRTGAVDVAEIDDKILRLLRLAERVGALESATTALTPAPEAGLLRELAARSTVVLRDVGHQLPRDPATICSVALIGPNAVDAFIQGGGSAHVAPDHLVTPAAGLRAALPGAVVTVHRGGYARPHAPELDVRGRVTDPVTGVPGLRIELCDEAGEVLEARVLPGPWSGWLRDLPTGAVRARLAAQVALDEPGEHWLGIGTVGRHEISVDGTVVSAADRVVGAEVVLDSSVNNPAAAGLAVQVESPRYVQLGADLQVVRTDGYGSFVRAALRHRPPGPSIEDEIAAAGEAARDADLVVVVVGTNDEVESEGWDRTSLALPGCQDELVERVVAANPDAVIVVNAGAPVLLPWLDRARTVLWSWFPGQECGDALGDVLLGVTEPSGRLPWTLPATQADVPVPDAIPDARGVVEYHDDIHVGYRSWERGGRTPAAPFGHGLGWTDWAYDAVRAAPATDDGVELIVTIRNVGPRSGHEVVQAYLESPQTGPERPVRWLAGFAVVQVAPGGTATTSVHIPRRSFEVWDIESHGWNLPAGPYRVRVGRSIRDLRLGLDVDPPNHPRKGRRVAGSDIDVPAATVGGSVEAARRATALPGAMIAPLVNRSATCPSGCGQPPTAGLTQRTAAHDGRSEG
jgi:beta-glucosidase